ncbi:MAG: hypothetical protein ACTHOG_12520 [Marmoricola sp.]
MLALVLVALAGGSELEPAARRAEEAFGARGSRQLRTMLQRCVPGAAPQVTLVQSLLREDVPARGGRRWLVLVGLLLAAVGLTLAAIALVLPSTTELGLAGW